MAQTLAPAQLALCAAVCVYLESEADEVANETMSRLGQLLLGLFRRCSGDATDVLGADATLMDVLALLQVGTVRWLLHSTACCP